MTSTTKKTRKINLANFIPDQPQEEGPAYSSGPIRASRPSNKNDVVDPTSLSSLALKYLTIPDLKPIVADLSLTFEMPPGYKTTKSGGWNAKKAVMIGRALLFTEGREMLLNALKMKNDQVDFDSDLKNFSFETKTREGTRSYPANIAPSFELWEELVKTYGDENPDRNPKFDQDWFDYYFKKTNRDPGEEYAEYDDLKEDTIKELRTSTLRDLTNVNGISRTRERLITEMLRICGRLTTESLEVAIQVLKDKYEEALQEAEGAVETVEWIEEEDE